MSRRNKRARLPKEEIISVEDKEQMRKVYALRGHYADSLYITPMYHPKSSLVRLTFTERNETLGTFEPTHAIVVTMDKLQEIYNLVGLALQNARSVGRLD